MNIYTYDSGEVWTKGEVLIVIVSRTAGFCRCLIILDSKAQLSSIDYLQPTREGGWRRLA